MIIKLKNFKCWENQTFEIPDNSVTLISGNSGKGKTSILQAIYYALYGEGKKIVRIGATSCKVELIFEDVHIIRSNKPNKLILNGIYEDIIAQEMINKKFGTHFNIVSYIEQDSFKSIIYMTPNERLGFLESFVYDEVNIENLKNNLKIKLREYEDDNIKCKSEVELYTNILKSITRPVLVNKPSDERCDISCLKDKVNELLLKHDSLINNKTTSLINKSKYNNIKENISTIEHEILTLYADIDNLKYIGDEKYNSLVSKLEYLKEYNEYISVKSQYESIYAQYTKLKEKELSDNEENISRIKNVIWDKYTKQECEYKLRILGEQKVTNKYFIDNKKKLESLEVYYNEYNELLPYTGTVSSCPSCNCSISIIDKQVFLYKEYDESKVNRVNEIKNKYLEYQRLSSLTYTYVDNVDSEFEELEKYFKNNLKMEESLKQLELGKPSPILQNLIEKCQTIKSKLKQLKVPTDIIHDDISNVENTITEQSKIKVLYNRLNSDINTKKSYLNKLNKDLSLISITPIYDIEHLIKINTEMRNNIEHDIIKGNNINTEWEKYNDYLLKNEEYINIETKLEDSKIKLLLSENNIKNGYTLKQIITKSETYCLENIINTLNIHAQNLLDIFFSDTPISVKFITYKEIKSGKSKIIKPQIDLQIMYKGNEIDLNSLSGGERARISLAYTLALSEIYKSPILMLDESISSLDYESTTDVISAIKEYFINKVVLCISHQANTGIFDNIIEI